MDALPLYKWIDLEKNYPIHKLSNLEKIKEYFFHSHLDKANKTEKAA